MIHISFPIFIVTHKRFRYKTLQNNNKLKSTPYYVESTNVTRNSKTFHSGVFWRGIYLIYRRRCDWWSVPQTAICLAGRSKSSRSRSRSFVHLVRNNLTGLDQETAVVNVPSCSSPSNRLSNRNLARCDNVLNENSFVCMYPSMMLNLIFPQTKMSSTRRESLTSIDFGIDLTYPILILTPLLLVRAKSGFSRRPYNVPPLPIVWSQI